MTQEHRSEPPQAQPRRAPLPPATLDDIERQLIRLTESVQRLHETQMAQLDALQDGHSGRQNVVVRDVEMSFWAMVEFMVKWAIAVIPAAILLSLVGLLVLMVFGGVFRSMY